MTGRLNGLWILLAVVLILGYLVARPHLGTAYVEYVVSDNGQKHEGGVFVHRADCDREAASVSAAPGPVSGSGEMIPDFSHLPRWAGCRAETRLLWGW